MVWQYHSTVQWFQEHTEFNWTKIQRLRFLQFRKLLDHFSKHFSALNCMRLSGDIHVNWQFIWYCYILFNFWQDSYWLTKIALFTVSVSSKSVKIGISFIFATCSYFDALMQWKVFLLFDLAFILLSTILFFSTNYPNYNHPHMFSGIPLLFSCLIFLAISSNVYFIF